MTDVIKTKVLNVMTNPTYPGKITYVLESTQEPNGKKLTQKTDTQYAYPGDEVDVTLKAWTYQGKSGHSIEKITVTKKGPNHGVAAKSSSSKSGGGDSVSAKAGLALKLAAQERFAKLAAGLIKADEVETLAPLIPRAVDFARVQDEVIARLSSTDKPVSPPSEAVDSDPEEEIQKPVAF